VSLELDVFGLQVFVEAIDSLTSEHPFLEQNSGSILACDVEEDDRLAVYDAYFHVMELHQPGKPPAQCKTVQHEADTPEVRLFYLQAPRLVI
jgi:hypothetical protein